MQQALYSFNEVSPTYLGGNDSISLSINVLHNFANSSHYDSLDFGPCIVLWVMDNDAQKTVINIWFSIMLLKQNIMKRIKRSVDKNK